MNMRKKWKLIVIAPAAIVGVLVLVTIFVAIGGEIVKQLWNWLLPPLFGWHQVTLVWFLFSGVFSSGPGLLSYFLAFPPPEEGKVSESHARKFWPGGSTCGKRKSDEGAIVLGEARSRMEQAIDSLRPRL